MSNNAPLGLGLPGGVHDDRGTDGERRPVTVVQKCVESHRNHPLRGAR